MKTDLKKTLDSYQARTGEIRLLQVPPSHYLMVDGHGDPNTTPAYPQALQALYPLAYALKFLSKEEGHDYVVPPLEGLWWAKDMSAFTTRRTKDEWEWTLMLLVPTWLEDEHVQEARQRLQERQGDPSGPPVRHALLTEGTCVQTLHVGPYDAEEEVLQVLHEEYLPQHDLQPRGHHHEIYLSDPRRTAPEKLRTILRQSVQHRPR